MFRTKIKSYLPTSLLTLAVCFSQMTPNALSQDQPKSESSTKQVSPRTRAIQIQLDEQIGMPFVYATPLEDVLKYITQATTTRSHPGIPIYVEPLGLEEAKQTINNSTVTIRDDNATLGVKLTTILAQRRLAYVVKDDVLIVSSIKGIEREKRETMVLAKDASPKTMAVLAKLNEPIRMSFANGKPLEVVLKHIKTATTSATYAGIPIVVDAAGLEEVHRSTHSTVLIDLNHVPLKTTLRLTLKQLGLTYTVRDGQLVISSPKGIQNLGNRPIKESVTRATNE